MVDRAGTRGAKSEAEDSTVASALTLLPRGQVVARHGRIPKRADEALRVAWALGHVKSFKILMEKRSQHESLATSRCGLSDYDKGFLRELS